MTDKELHDFIKQADLLGLIGFINILAYFYIKRDHRVARPQAAPVLPGPLRVRSRDSSYWDWGGPIPWSDPLKNLMSKFDEKGFSFSFSMCKLPRGGNYNQTIASYTNALERGFHPEDFLGLTDWQVTEGLFKGFTPGEVIPLKNKSQLLAMAKGLSFTQVNYPWFSEQHSLAASEGIPYRKYQGLHGAEVERVLQKNRIDQKVAFAMAFDPRLGADSRFEKNINQDILSKIGGYL